MRKIRLNCSLLLAVCASMFGMGCEEAKKPATPATSAPEKTEKAAKPATAPAKKDASPGSTTGGGVEVPAGKGAVETPKEPVADPKDPAAPTENKETTEPPK